MRVYALSDIHVDYAENMSWIQELSAWDHQDDCLILAGDVTHDLGRLEKALTTLRRKFRQLFYVPGNHELWIMKTEHMDSLQKFERILQLCAQWDVRCGPTRVGEDLDAVWIVPLFSWYVLPDERGESLYLPKTGGDAGLKAWSDTYFVRWPDFPGGLNAAEYFLKRNEPRIQRGYDAPVISFSHFLSRLDLMFPHGTDMDAVHERVRKARANPMVGSDTRRDTGRMGFNFSRVAGDAALDRQIRALGSRLHVHGHQHRNRFRQQDDVWYVSHCLGYAHERNKGHISHIDGGPVVVWGERGCTHDRPPILIYR